MQTEIYDNYFRNTKLSNPIKRILDFNIDEEQKKSIKELLKSNNYKIDIDIKIDEQTIYTNKNINKAFLSIPLLKKILETNIAIFNITQDELDNIFNSIIQFYEDNKNTPFSIELLNTIEMLLINFNDRLINIELKEKKTLEKFNKKKDYMNIIKYVIMLKSIQYDIATFILISKANFKNIYNNPYYKEELFISEKSSSSDLNHNTQIINKDFIEYPNAAYNKYKNIKYTLELFNSTLLLRLKKTIQFLKNLLLNNLHIFKYHKFTDINAFDEYKGTPTLNKLVKNREYEIDLDNLDNLDDMEDLDYSDLTPNIIEELFTDIIDFLRNKNKITKSKLIELNEKLEIILASFKVNFKTIINIDKYKDNLKIGDFKNKYKDYKNFIRYITILNKLQMIIYIAFIHKYQNQIHMLKAPSSLSARSSARDYIDDFNIEDQFIPKHFGEKIIYDKMFKRMNMQEPPNAFKARNRFTSRAIKIA
jgi:hypothetical protein